MGVTDKIGGGDGGNWSVAYNPYRKRIIHLPVKIIYTIIYTKKSGSSLDK